MMENLKSCPFCGGKPYSWQAAGGAWFVSCGSDRKDEDGCYQRQHRAGGMTPEAWNTRPSPARDEGAGTMEVTRAAEDAACAAYRALDMGQRWTLEPAMRAALKAALPHLADAPVSAPLDRQGKAAQQKK